MQAEADLVVEAAPERMELKRRLFRDVEAAAPPSALLATNTSSLSIDTIAEVLAEPGPLRSGCTSSTRCT